MKRRALLASTAALAAGASFIPAHAQQLTKEVRLLNGFPPGGTADLLCRFLGDGLKTIVNQPVVVEGKTGASGYIAAEACARAPADGHTLFLAPMALMTVSPNIPGQKIPIDPRTDLTPILNIAGVYNILVVGKQVPYRTVPELIAAAKKEPGKLTYASAGNGTSQHLAAELFKRLAGVDLLHIPYRGGAPAIQDMIAGNVNMMFGNMPEFLGQIRGGNLIPVAFGAAKASSLFPEVPVMSQFLPEFKISNWFSIVGPKGLSQDWVKFWNENMRKAMATAEMKKRMDDNGMEILAGTTEELVAQIRLDDERWKGVIQAAGIRAD